MTSYESEVFYLAEMWHTTPSEIANIPYSMRKRLCEQKDDLERRRQAHSKASSNRRTR